MHGSVLRKPGRLQGSRQTEATPTGRSYTSSVPTESARTCRTGVSSSDRAPFVMDSTIARLHERTTLRRKWAASMQKLQAIVLMRGARVVSSTAAFARTTMICREPAVGRNGEYTADQQITPFAPNQAR